jgi:hypothetical protein
MSEAFGIVDPAQLPVRRLDIIKPRGAGLLKFSTQIAGAVEEVGDWTDVAGDLVGTVDGHEVTMSGAAHKHLTVVIPADAEAGTENTETLFGVMPGKAAKVIGVRLIATEAVVGHADNYATVSVYTRDGLGAGLAKVWTVTTKGTSWGSAFALNSGSFEGEGAPTYISVAADTVLTYDSEKFGTGVKLPALVLVVEYVNVQSGG